MKIKNVEIGGYIQSKKDSKQLIAGHCYQVAEKDVSDKTVRLFSVDDSFDDSLWFCVSDFRKPRPQPQLKQLDQSVFKNMHERWKFAAVDQNAETNLFEEKPVISSCGNYWVNASGAFKRSVLHFDNSNWQNSLIERDIAKELAEVDLSSGLTGSDLALELLKNQRYIIASVSDVSDADAIECGNNKLIHKSSEDIFTDDMGGIYCWAVALNNQGEPLTAAEVGL